MKEPKSSDIRARIDLGLKQEFCDVFGDMSKKLINLIEEALQAEKSKYLSGIIAICSKNNNNISMLNKILDCYNKAFPYDEKGPLTIGNYENLNSINVMADEMYKSYGEAGKEIFKRVNQDLVNGLYKGSEKDSLEERIYRLNKNRERVMSFVINQVYSTKHEI